MEIERRAGTQRANCGWAGCDWLAARPRLTWLDMGIYWRQPHQSAPHLINEPEHCMDQEFLHIQAVVLSSAARNCNRYEEETFVVCLLSAEAAHIAATRRAYFVFDFKIVRMLLDVYLFQLL